MNIKKIGLKAAFTLPLMLMGLSTTIAADAPTSTDATPPPLSSAEIKQIQQVIQNYLLTNPEILIAAGQELQKKQLAQQHNAAMTAISKNKQQIFNDSSSPVMGNPQGSIVLVEFYDYQCGHCKSMSNVIHSVIKNNNNVKLILKELPIFEGNSNVAAKASLAVYKLAPKKYAEFHEKLLAVEGPLSKETIINTASDLGIKPAILEKEMESQAIKEEIANNMQLATSIGIQGTPSFIVSSSELNNFIFIPGATSEANLMSEFKKIQTKETTP